MAFLEPIFEANTGVTLVFHYHLLDFQEIPQHFMRLPDVSTNIFFNRVHPVCY
jgi:hypothetical protein